MGEDVQKGTGDGQGRREAHPYGQDAHVLDGRVSQQALQVTLGSQVESAE